MPTLAILGPGAIGCSVGAALVEAARGTVFFCAHNPFDRLHVTFPTGPVFDQPVHVETSPEGLAPVDWLLVCVKATQVEAAEPWLRALVGPETRVAVLQNGVEHHERLVPLIGEPERILPVVVDLPAERTAPGTVRISRSPSLLVPQDRLGHAFQTLFEGSRILVRPTADFLTRLWEKLCLNALSGAITALTERDHSVLREPEIAALAHQIAVECILVGRAEGATLSDDLPGKILELLTRPPAGGNSMLYDRLAGHPLEADARNGVIVRLGAKHGIRTPINATLYALLKNVKPHEQK